ncbi:MAG: recombinase family protein [Candidatus Woesebacteria bacterium]|nr:MAG: recombinase family protein [Candidatus Woesebacteria bacterium]
MNIPREHKRAVVLARASGTKQVTYGDSVDGQVDDCSRVIEKNGWERVKVFPLVESGRIKERVFFEEVLDYCINPQNNIDVLLFKDISRFTRGGAKDYARLKDLLKENNIEIQDIEETVKKERNTLEDLGMEYSWSVYSPSEAEELRKAESSKEEVRTILTRMISKEISYTRRGYWNRSAPYGFQNIKIETETDGKRNVLEEHNKEGFFIIKMFELREKGVFDDKQIVKRINQLGFISRMRIRRDPKTKKPIGKIGGVPLTVKQFQSYISRPIYAGVICEKWTKHIPVLAKFKGLVSIETFNKANRGKVYLEIKNSEASIEYNRKKQIRLKDNPYYPYKKMILCPMCYKTPKASASTGKNGIPRPAYHCDRGHESWRVKRSEVHKVMEDFIINLKLDDSFLRLFEYVFIEKWKEKRTGSIKESEVASETVAKLLAQQSELADSLRFLSNKIAISKVEEKIEELEHKIQESRSIRDKKEESEQDIKTKLKYARHLVEHPSELLINEPDMFRQQQLFELTFERTPTYAELVSGTPKLTPIFDLNSEAENSKERLVTPLGVEPRLPG